MGLTLAVRTSALCEIGNRSDDYSRMRRFSAHVKQFGRYFAGKNPTYIVM
jgi:hypothetical protein